MGGKAGGFRVMGWVHCFLRGMAEAGEEERAPGEIDMGQVRVSDVTRTDHLLLAAACVRH